ncbi:MAG: ABC transporter permease [Desulfurococcales archaeon]|nr:ABC transporter permease [Desulfurococcales archaeon]
MVATRSILAVTKFELLRESNKRTIYFVIILMVFPLIVSLIIKAYSENTIKNSMLWAVIMGYTFSESSLAAVGANILSVISWGWLIAILFGGDLLASDFTDGTLALILARPVSRLEYVLGKILSATIMMVIVFLAGGLSVYAAAWILGGPQSGFLEVLLLSTLLGIGAMPLLLLSAWFGMKFRKPLIGYVLGFVAYFVSSIAVGLASVYYLIVGGDPDMGVKVLNLLRAFLPLSDISYLSETVFAKLHPETSITIPIGNTLVSINQSTYLPYALGGLVAWLIILVIISWYTIRKADI